MHQDTPLSPNIPTATPKPPGHREEIDTTNLTNISTYAVDDLALLEENRRTILAEREKHGHLPGSQPTSPLSNPSGGRRRLSEVKAIENSKVTGTASSPTAVPFRWREPPQSPGLSRSLSSNPLSLVSQQADTEPTRPKIRPRSTEFKSSTEFRPLWLVERHGPRHVSASDDVYPSLPSSHTTSRASSIRDPEETTLQDDSMQNLNRPYSEPFIQTRGLIIDTERVPVQSDLLDSQEPTPTASSFQAAERSELAFDNIEKQPLTSTGNIVVPPASEGSSRNIDPRERQPQDVSDLLPACRPASPLNHNHELSSELFPTTERGNDNLVPANEHGVDQSSSLRKATDLAVVEGGSGAFDIADITQCNQQPETSLSDTHDGLAVEDDKFLTAQVHQITADEEYVQEDSFSNLDPTKKEKKEERAQATFKQDEIERIIPTLGSSPLSPSQVSGRLNAEKQKQLEEQDAQDAVDSWFAPSTPKKGKKGKKEKKKGRSENLIGKSQSPVNDTVSSVEASTAMSLGNAMVGPIASSALDSIEMREAIKATPEDNVQFPTSEPSQLAKCLEGDQQLRVSPNNNLTDILDAGAQETKAREDDMSDIDPTGDQSHVDAEAQNLGSNFRKKGKKNKKASFTLWQESTKAPSHAGTVKDKDIDTTTNPIKLLDESMPLQDDFTGQISQAKSHEPETSNEHLTFDLNEETYELSAPSKKKGKKGQKKAHANTRESFDTPLESPPKTSVPFQDEQDSFGVRSDRQGMPRNVALDIAESAEIPTEAIDDDLALTKKAKARGDKKGTEMDSGPIVRAIDELQAQNTTIGELEARDKEQPESLLPGAVESESFHDTGENAKEYQDHNGIVPAEGLDIPLTSSEATPLPLDDDLDLLDALPESPLSITADHGARHLDSTNHSVGGIEYKESFNPIENVLELTPSEATRPSVGTTLQLSDTSSKAPALRPIDHESDSANISGDIEHQDLPTAVDTIQDLGLPDDTPREASIQETETRENDLFALTTRKKSKKSKKSKQSIPMESELDKASKIDSAAPPPGSVRNSIEDLPAIDSAHNGTVEAPEQLENYGWAASGRKKGKKGKKESFFTIANQPTRPSEQNLPASPATPWLDDGDSQTRNITDGKDSAVSQEPVAEDQWANPGKKGKKGRKQKLVSKGPNLALSEPQESMLLPFDHEQSDLNVHVSANDASLVGPPQPLSQSRGEEVQAEIATVIASGHDESMRSGEILSRDLPQTTADYDDEWAKPAKKKKGKKGNKDKNVHVPDSQDWQTASDTKDDKSLIEAPIATTDAAEKVRDIHAEPRNAFLARPPFDISVKGGGGSAADGLNDAINQELDESRRENMSADKTDHLLPEVSDNDHGPQAPSEAAQLGKLPLLRGHLAHVSEDSTVDTFERVESVRDPLLRTQSEPIVNTDQRADRTILQPSIVPPVIISPQEAEEIEMVRAVSPETAALLSRDDEKPPHALKAADIVSVPEPELDTQLPYEDRGYLHTETQPYITYLDPIAEDQVLDIEKLSTVARTEPEPSELTDKIVDKAEEGIQTPFAGAESAPEYLPTLNREDKKKAKRDGKSAWSDDLDLSTSEAEHPRSVPDVQAQVPAEASTFPADPYTAFIPDAFEGFPTIAKDDEIFKGRETSTMNEGLPMVAPGSQSVIKDRQLQGLPSPDDVVNYPLVAQDGIIEVESEGLGKGQRDNIARLSIGEDITITPMLDVEPALKHIETQKDFMNDTAETSTEKQIQAPANEYIAVSKSKKEKKKSKRSSAFVPWEDEASSGVPEQLERQKSTQLEEDPSLAQANFRQLEEPLKSCGASSLTEDFEDSSKRNEIPNPESLMHPVTQAESTRLEEQIREPIIEQERMEDSSPTVATNVDPDVDDHGSIPKSKKDKKAKKMTKAIAGDDGDVAVTPTNTEDPESIMSRDGHSQGLGTAASDIQNPASDPGPIVAERAPSEAISLVTTALPQSSDTTISFPAKQIPEVEPSFDTTYSIKKNKKGKKKAKQAQALRWDEEPTPVEASESVEEPLVEIVSATTIPATISHRAPEIIFESQAEPTAESNPQSEATLTYGDRSSKRDKKNKKKAQAFDGDEEVASAEASLSTEESAVEVRPTAIITQHTSSSVLDPQVEPIEAQKPTVGVIHGLEQTADKMQESNPDKDGEVPIILESSQSTEDHVLSVNSSPPSDVNTIVPPVQLIHQEFIHKSEDMGLVQPLKQNAQDHYTEQRDSRDKSTAIEDESARGLSQAIYDPVPVHEEKSSSEPLGKEVLPNLEPTKILSRASMSGILSAAPQDDVDHKVQDGQGQIDYADKNPQQRLANLEILEAAQMGSEAQSSDPSAKDTKDNHASNDANKDDDLWNATSKKNKKGKKQRRDRSVALETPQPSEGPYVSTLESSLRSRDSIEAGKTNDRGVPPISAGSGESSELAMISDYETPRSEWGSKKSASTASQLPGEEHKPAVPIQAVDEAKTPGPISTTVDGNTVPPDDFPSFSASKKNKKGKKGKKQETPIIWEDDTATLPATDGTRAITDEAAELPTNAVPLRTPPVPEGYNQQRDLMVGEEAQHTQQSWTNEMIVDNVPSHAEFQGNFGELPQDMDNADDYFSIPHGQKTQQVKEERGPELREPWRGESNQEPSTQLRESQKSMDAIDGTEKATEPSRKQRDLVDSSVSEEPVEADQGYVKAKKEKKGKKCKRKMVEIDADTAHSNAGGLDEQRKDQEDSNEPMAIEGIATAAAAGLGLGITATEGLQWKDSKKEDERDTRSTKIPESTQFAGGKTTRSSQETYNDDEAEVHAQAETPVRHAFAVALQRFQDTPPPSPQLSNQTRPEDHPSRFDHIAQRDSAIQISDSPMISGEIRDHRMIRDSGYQDMEASPVMGVGPGPGSNIKDRNEQENDICMDYHERSLRSHDQDSIPDRNTLDVSVEVSPEYDVSVSRSTPKHDEPKKPVLANNQPVVYSIDDRRSSHPRSRDLPSDDLREPSPVNSTTKDRSSILFQSSPSTRVEALGHSRQFSSPTTEQAAAEHFTDEAKREPADEARTRNMPTQESLDPTKHALHMTSPSGRIIQGPGSSLFGGPVGIISDITSPPRSPFNPDGSNRRRLDTISENNPEASPLHKKGRHLTDVGSPEHGVKSLRRSTRPQAISQQRVQSPTREITPKELVSTDDLIARLSWPAVDEDKHAVDLERSRSRTTDHSNHSNAPVVPRESDRRSVSGASIRSGDSINAIIRTPDQVRSASGQGYRSSGTPPLRRVDHRVSGDLRLANRKSEAKLAKLAKEREADELEHDILALPSSSTYDPVKDKGKTRVKDMTDVFVSCLRSPVSVA